MVNFAKNTKSRFSLHEAFNKFQCCYSETHLPIRVCFGEGNKLDTFLYHYLPHEYLKI